MSQLVVLVCFCEGVCVHVVDVINCAVLMFLWVTRKYKGVMIDGHIYILGWLYVVTATDP
jgi:hypothetical protein